MAAELAVALDVPDPEAALALADRLDGGAEVLKIGLELFTAAGPGLVSALRARGERIFLDLKLHDIPNTVAGAVRAAAALEVDFLTVHASGGEAMLRGAVEAAAGAPRPLRLLAVTVLTSSGPAEVAAAWGRDRVDPEAEVLRLAELAWRAGVRGVVASAQEAAALRRRFGGDLRIVTPGIRPAGVPAHDQARVATPEQAVRAGADLLVLGRAVTSAPDPAAALRAIRASIVPFAPAEVEGSPGAGGVPGSPGSGGVPGSPASGPVPLGEEGR